jgi:tetratricopeptide (TPR) repeat protein
MCDAETEKVDYPGSFKKLAWDISARYKVATKPETSAFCGHSDARHIPCRSHRAAFPEDGYAYRNLGLRYIAARRNQEAALAFVLAAKYLSPDDTETATALSLGCIQDGDLARAIKLLRKALACESYYIPARYLLGVAYLIQGRYGEAVRAFEVVVALDSRHAYAVMGLGIAYRHTGQDERAREAFAAVRRRWPDSPEVLLALARAYRASGLPREALECIARVLALAPAAETVVWRARRLLTAIEYEESTAHSRV